MPEHQNPTQRALQVAARVDAIEPFRVMEMVKQAAAMSRAGIDVISMSVGEPDFTAPEMVAHAAMEAIRGGATQLTADHLREHWGDRSRGVLVASPSNPTGTSMTVPQARELLAAVRERGGFAIVDEIYQGLSYDGTPVSALALDDGVITVNSFSK